MKTLQTNLVISIVFVALLHIPSVSAGPLRNPPRIERQQEKQEQKQDNQTKKEAVITNAKNRFETEKQNILEKANSGEITKQEAKARIEKAKEDILVRAKEDIKQQMDQQKAENREKVKMMIREKMQKILSKIESLPRRERRAQYEKLLQSIDKQMQSGKLSEKDKMLT